jgi:hypothetical protein
MGPRGPSDRPPAEGRKAGKQEGRNAMKAGKEGKEEVRKG